MRRWPLLVAVVWAFWAVLFAWTVRAAWPSRHPVIDETVDHYLPLDGDRLFTLTPEAGKYRVEDGDVDCEADTVGVDEELRCDGYRFFVRKDGDADRLVLEGVAAQLPSTVGTGLAATYRFPVPGLGAEHLELLPIDRCAATTSIAGAEDATPQPVVCLRNGGASGSLIVDRSARASDTAPLARVRVAPAHGEAVLVDERDLVWAGMVPFRVRKKDGLVLLSVPQDDWTTIAGDRRWMSLELPSWPLAKPTDVRKHVFWSRDALFSTSPDPLAWREHLADWRVEWQQEERLQRFVDAELLCYDAESRKLTWNLETGVGCDGVTPIAAPPAELYRLAEQAAYQPGTSRVLAQADDDLAGLPERTPDPAGMVFVFDWALADVGGERVRVPTRLLGVRPGATRNGPPIERAAVEGEGVCALAKSGQGRAPIDVRKGSSSPWLEVVEDGALPEGTKLLLPDGDGTICVWKGDRTPAGATRLESAASPKLPLPPTVLTLGAVHVRLERVGRTAWWSPGADAELPDKAKGACARLTRVDGAWTVTATGDANDVRVGEALSEGTHIPIADGMRLRVGPASGATGADPDVVDLVLHAPEDPDAAAFSAVQGDRVVRRYPFGRDLSPVIGFGPLAGGVEGAADPDVWKQANEDWKKTACTAGETPAATGVAGIELTIDGDLQRIVSTELLAMEDACRSGDPQCPKPGDRRFDPDAVRAQAVLIDAKTGDVLAVGNAPAFDPNDPHQVDDLEAALRLAGPHGTLRVPSLENQAFLRSKNAGSAYKLATSYALATAGRLSPEAAKPVPTLRCTRFTWYTAADDAKGDADAEDEKLYPSWTPDGPRSQPCGPHDVALGNVAYGYHDAFRESINLFFGVAPFALVPGTGVDYAPPKAVSGVSDPMTNPLGDGTGLWTWAHDGRTDLGVTLAGDFDVANGLSDPAKNPFLDTLVRLGHRYHYPKAGGGVLYTQSDDGVGATSYPTAKVPWLPGMEVGGGFRYPSLVGPEAYAVEGVPGWSERQVVLHVKRDGKDVPVAMTVGTSSIREYSRLAYGMGGVEASALSLAVIGTPMARPDGAAVSPNLFASTADGRVMATGLVGKDRDVLEEAMRAVPNEAGSTAYGFLPKDVAGRIGGKTGTFEIAKPTSAVARTSPEKWAAVTRLVEEGCGVQGVVATDADLALVRSAVDDRSKFKRWSRYLADRPYVATGLADVKPAPGFAASAQTCAAWELNPGRAKVGSTVDGVDGGLWLDGLLGAFPMDGTPDETIEGSSFVAVVFDGLVDAEPGQPAPGQGWVLAVIMDGHPTGAKRAAGRILERLREHELALQGAEAPVAKIETQDDAGRTP